MNSYYDQEEKEKKPNKVGAWIKKHRKGCITGVSVLSVILVAALVFFIGVRPLLLRAKQQLYLGNALRDIERSLKGDKDSLSSRLLSVCAGSSRQGSFKVKADLSLEDGPVSMEASLASNREKTQYLMNYRFFSDLSGQTDVIADFEMDLEAYLDLEQVSIASNALFGGDTHYGISLPDFKDKIENSVFAPESSSKYALSADEVKMLSDGVSAVNQALGKSRTAWDKFREQVKLAWKAVLEYKKPIITKETVTIREKEEKATVLTYAYDVNDLKNSFSIMADGVLKNDTLAEILGEKLFSEIKYSLRSAIEELNALPSGQELNLILYLGKGNRVMQARLSDPIGQMEDIVLTLGNVNGKDTFTDVELSFADMSIRLKSEGDHKSQSYTDKTVINVKGGDGYISGTATISTTWDQKEGDLTTELLLNDGESSGRITMTGKLVFEGSSSFELYIENISAALEGEEMELPLVLSAKADTASEISRPEMKNILDMKEEEIDTLGEAVVRSVENIIPDQGE